jgi:hypothetical protein
VGAFGHLALAKHDLGDPAGVAQIDEDHPTVIPPPGHPAGEGDCLAGVLGTQCAGIVGAKHYAGSSLASIEFASAGLFADGKG